MWFPRRLLLTPLLVAPLTAANFHRDSLAIPESAKVTVSSSEYDGITNPNPAGGWYYKCANVVAAANSDLVACWQVSDSHTSVLSYLMVARSTDGGHTWGDYHVISKSDVWNEGGIWVVPQMSVLHDGRIVIISDWGQRRSHQHFPMLAHWQKPDRGMSNHVFWSDDHGRTWSAGEKIDDIGGEPSYILELADGTLAYTRTSSNVSDVLENPPLPWGDIYYRNEIVFSDDGGATWGRPTWVTDSPYHGDCEVGLVETAPGELMAVTRIGLGNGQFGNPSRLVFSEDGGRTWPRVETAPFYAQRPHVRRLQSGRYLVTYRNRWGTPGSRALVFDPAEDTGFQPNSWILEEERCELSDDTLTLRTATGQYGAVTFNLHPVQDSTARVEIEATLRVEAADTNGVVIGAGTWVHFAPDRIYLGDSPELGFACDTTEWHDYHIVRANGFIEIRVDGKVRLREPTDSIWTRQVRWGNRAVQGIGPSGFKEPYSANGGVSHWRKVHVRVDNPDDASIDWQWSPGQGYPDQFRRDRTVVLDYASGGDGGYSMWTQLADGRIVILDYTTGGDLIDHGSGHGSAPFVRAYLVTEDDLVRP
jgi:hypothetical protein